MGALSLHATTCSVRPAATLPPCPTHCRHKAAGRQIAKQKCCAAPSSCFWCVPCYVADIAARAAAACCASSRFAPARYAHASVQHLVYAFNGARARAHVLQDAGGLASAVASTRGKSALKRISASFPSSNCAYIVTADKERITIVRTCVDAVAPDGSSAATSSSA
ncbi:hypothetical protein EON67_04630 [archaeon]|nr:MAG: hypothetical protein EON67_04630 [archaeon]